MKFTTFAQIFKFPWEDVATSFWVRYPNPYSKHVLSEDTISRDIQDGKLFTKRLLSKTNKMPKWGERIVPGLKNVCVVEESVVDPTAKTIITYTRNIGYSKILSIEERCVYKVGDEDGTTLCERQVWATSGLFGFSRALESFGVERFKSNAAKTFAGFQHVLNSTQNKPDSEIKPTITHPSLQRHKEKLRESTERIKESAQKAKTLTKQNVSV